MTGFEEIGAEIGKLVADKNKKYGNSYAEAHKVIEALYPDGIKVDQYPDALVLIRVVDKLFRISKGDEGEESAWKDIAGYGIAMVKSSEDNHLHISAREQCFVTDIKIIPCCRTCIAFDSGMGDGAYGSCKVTKELMASGDWCPSFEDRMLHIDCKCNK